MIKHVFLGVALSILILCFLTSCGSMKVRRTARKIQVDKNTVMVGSSLIPYHHRKVMGNRIFYYRGNLLVCIITKKGIATDKSYGLTNR